MVKRGVGMLGTLVLGCTLCPAQETSGEKPVVKHTPIKETSAASGKEMFTQYCAPCHGAEGKGDGPAASAMRAAPADLTQLAKKHDGKYPVNLVANVLKFGTGASNAHGSAEMPVWGPLFESLDKHQEALVQQRANNLVNYIGTLQGK